jgi:hypothetical protein
MLHTISNMAATIRQQPEFSLGHGLRWTPTKLEESVKIPLFYFNFVVVCSVAKILPLST